MKAIEHVVKGIKCDNPKCDWKDMDAEFIPEKWLNKPCPECSRNLFTQESWDQMKTMLEMVDKVNSLVDSLGLKITEGDERVCLKLSHNERGLVDGAKIVNEN